MAKNLREFIDGNKDLIVEAMELPEVNRKALAVISGMGVWCKRNHLKIKQLKVSHPIGPIKHYDVHFKISKRLE